MRSFSQEPQFHLKARSTNDGLSCYVIRLPTRVEQHSNGSRPSYSEDATVGCPLPERRLSKYEDLAVRLLSITVPP
jgi:hypothetical protein